MENSIRHQLDTHRKKYEEDIKKIKQQQENITDIRTMLKEELCPKFKNLIGVFGSYKHTFSDDMTGSDAIDYIANKLARTNVGCLVITGNYHYFFSEAAGSIIRERNLQDTLQDFVNEEAITSMGYSQILASICHMAVFLMTPGRTTSAFEEVEFCKNLCEHNLLGIGAYILNSEEKLENAPCGCYSFNKRSKETLQFFTCDDINTEIQNCQGYIHKINHSTLELFIKRSFTCLVVTHSWQSVPDIFNEITNELSLV